MKRLFTGKFGRIPVAVLLTVLLTVIIAGGVVAATGGYVLWEGTVDVLVDEAIAMQYGNTMETCDTALNLGDPMPDFGLWPGFCRDTWFEFTSASPGDLLVKASTIVTAGGAGDPADVSVEFYDEYGDPLPIDDAGLVISSADGSVYFYQAVCVDGSATPDWYYVSTTFTRESPPIP